MNGVQRFRESYEPLLPGCFHIASPNAYRNPFGECDPEALAEKCAAALDSEIEFQGAGTISAFIMEPVLGAGGVIVPHEKFMPAVREICSRNGILLIADEVITGFGRAGDWSGSRLWGVKPDIMTFAKAITSGYFPFGGVLVSEAIAEAFESASPASGMIGHGYTYSGHPVGAAAGLACLEETVRLQVQRKAAARGVQLFEGLKKLQRKHDVVGDVRGGKGLMLALELVVEKSLKTPIDKATIERIHSAIYNAGVMVRVSGHNILLSPPLILEESEAACIIEAIDTGLSSI